MACEHTLSDPYFVCIIFICDLYNILIDLHNFLEDFGNWFGDVCAEHVFLL